jgi:hypothetical protein
MKKKPRDSSNSVVASIRTMTRNCFRKSNFWCRSGKIRGGPPLCLRLNLQTRPPPTCTPPVISSRICSSSQHRGDRGSRSRQHISRSRRLTRADQILEREDDLIISLRIQSLLIVILLHTISSLHHQFIALSTQLSQMNQYHILFFCDCQWFIIYFIPVVCPLNYATLSILKHCFLSLLMKLVLRYIRVDKFNFHFLVWLRRLRFFSKLLSFRRMPFFLHH